MTGSPFEDNLLFLESCATSSPLSFSLLNCNLDIIIIQPEQLTTATSSIVQVTFDRGSEFIGQDFQKMIKEDYRVVPKPITVRNLQANSIVERVHQVIGNIIRTFEFETNYMDEANPWKEILSATAFAIRSTFHTTLKNIPGQLVFGHDMILNVKHEANWEYIRERKQKIIEKNNKAENAKPNPHKYKVGDKVLLNRGT